MFNLGIDSTHSTETTLVKVTNDMLLAADTGLASVLVLLDLSAAFDAIDHFILLQRLEHKVGIKGTALCRLKSYLTDRIQFVRVNQQSSPCSKMTCSAQFYFCCTCCRWIVLLEVMTSIFTVFLMVHS